MKKHSAKLRPPKADRKSIKLLHSNAPRMLDALQRLTHPNAAEDDLNYALAVIALATGVGKPCTCHGLEVLCEACGGTGCVPQGDVGV